MSGFIFIIVGFPMESSNCDVTISRLSLISTTVEPISVPSLNDITTIDIFWMEIDCSSLTLLIRSIACSTGSETAFSTSSGLAPGYVVITSAYGNSIFGRKSVLIF